MDEIKKQASILESKLAPLFSQAPHIPENGRQAIVSISPWLALLGGAFGLFSLYGLYQTWNWYNSMARGLGSLTQAFGGPLPSTGLGIGWYIAIIIMIIMTVLYFMSYSGLVSKQKSGWDKLFFAQIVTIIGGILAIFLPGGSVISSILGGIIGFYILFEIRSYYK